MKPCIDCTKKDVCRIRCDKYRAWLYNEQPQPKSAKRTADYDEEEVYGLVKKLLANPKIYNHERNSLLKIRGTIGDLGQRQINKINTIKNRLKNG
jgi:hypothetical protein